MPGIDKACEGPGATHHDACACREAYVKRLEDALRWIDARCETTAQLGFRRRARKALGIEMPTRGAATLEEDKTRLEVAVEALEYYADDQRWFEVTNALAAVRCCAIEERNGGDRARAALKQIRAVA